MESLPLLEGRLVVVVVVAASSSVSRRREEVSSVSEVTGLSSTKPMPGVRGV